MGAGGFHVRVRDGIVCGPAAMATRSSNAPPASARCIIFDAASTSGWCVAGSGLRAVAELRWLCGVVWMIAVRGGCGVGAVRAIRTGQLHALLRFHIRPIDVMVYHGPRGDLVSR